MRENDLIIAFFNIRKKSTKGSSFHIKNEVSTLMPLPGAPITLSNRFGQLANVKGDDMDYIEDENEGADSNT